MLAEGRHKIQIVCNEAKAWNIIIIFCIYELIGKKVMKKVSVLLLLFVTKHKQHLKKSICIAIYLYTLIETKFYQNKETILFIKMNNLSTRVYRAQEINYGFLSNYITWLCYNTKIKLY